MLWQKEEEGCKKERKRSGRTVKGKEKVLPLVKDSARSGKNFMGKVEMKGRQKPSETSISNIQFPLHASTSPQPLLMPEPFCWPWPSCNMPWLLLALPAETCLPRYCHPMPGQHNRVPGQLLSYGFQKSFSDWTIISKSAQQGNV